jgi:hypothetical protein
LRRQSCELNHLTGWIDELYAAMITRGQMALDTNQRGYDVVSAAIERISVETITTSSHVSFDQNSFQIVQYESGGSGSVAMARPCRRL